MMTVRSQFQQHLYDHAYRVGFAAPEPLLEYLTDLLADRLRDTEIIPQPSFAERYLQLYSTRRSQDLRDFGDQCLFFVSVLPDYGQRRGLDMGYYASLGISAYYSYSDLSRDARFTQLGNWFYHLQRFLNSALKPHQTLDLVDF